MEDQNRIWPDNRQHWQRQFIGSRLEQRVLLRNFNDKIIQLLVERERYWTDDSYSGSES